MNNFSNKICPRCGMKPFLKHPMTEEERKIYNNDLDLRRLYEERGLICECTRCGFVFYEKREYKEFQRKQITPVPKDEYVEKLGRIVAEQVGGYHAGWKALMHSIIKDKTRVFYEEDYAVDIAVIMHRIEAGKKNK